jgi:GNAT superfamily N-acetyltransferase
MATRSVVPPLPGGSEPVRADDRAAMDAWFALMVRCHAHDTPELPPPCPVGHVHRFTWPGYEQHAWIVRDGSEVVAAAELTMPQRDNLHFAFAAVLVAPAYRRRGIGSDLLRHLTADARLAGRTTLALGAGARPGATAPGSLFLRAAGARLAMVEKRRRLVLPAADPERLRDLATTARRASPGYRLVQWTGPTPPRWRADLAPLIGAMSTDAPVGDFPMEARHWDADRVAERDAAAVASGVRSVVTAAQATDGHLVAYTDAATCVVKDGFASQGDTLVARAHRGHRLGLRIKLANLELLVREHPEVRAIDTFNADDNHWMIAVNEAMGFVPIQHIEDWKLDLGADQAGTTAAISAAASGP